MKHRIRLVSVLCALLTFTLQPPACLQVWQHQQGSLQRIALPSSLSALPILSQADLDKDGEEEVVLLEGQRASIRNGNETLWQSPPEWRVERTALADFNHDGQLEVALLVWRPFESWPVDEHLPNPGRIASFHNSQGLSCHLILIGWYLGEFRERWAGSALAEPLNDFLPVDLNGDGYPELAVLESFYDDPAALPERALAVWEWNGFGFDLLARQRGRFSSLSASIDGEGNTLLLTGN